MNPEEYHSTQLEKMRALWDAGMQPALFQAVQYCASAQMPMPEWVALAVLNMIQDRFHDGNTKGTRGAYGSIKGRLKEDYAHYLKWSALSWTMTFDGISELPKGRGRRRKGEVTKEQLLASAAERLRGRRLAKLAGDAQIEASYRLVEASLAAGEKRFAFEDLYWPLE